MEIHLVCMLNELECMSTSWYLAYITIYEPVSSLVSEPLDEEKNGYVSKDQL